MKSKICHLRSSHTPITPILQEAEKTAAYAGLGKHESLQLRLLAEEMTGILKGIAGEFEADFWIEESYHEFTLHLSAEVRLNKEGKEKLVSMSTSGQNDIHRGVMGKIGRIFEAYLDSYDEVSSYCTQNGISLGHTNMLLDGAGMQPDGLIMWSLSQYKDSVKEAKEQESWDELEQSIVASLADEITVRIRNHKAEIIITKIF